MFNQMPDVKAIYRNTRERGGSSVGSATAHRDAPPWVPRSLREPPAYKAEQRGRTVASHGASLRSEAERPEAGRPRIRASRRMASLRNTSQHIASRRASSQCVAHVVLMLLSISSARDLIGGDAERVQQRHAA